MRKVTIVAVLVALAALGALALLLGRTEIGLRTRAAAADFRTARMLGVKANQVIGLAVVLSGALAAAVAVILTVQTPFVTPDFALHDTIIVLVGVVVGGIDRLWTATLGGFAIGFTSGHRQRRPADGQHDLPALGRDGARDPGAAAAPGRPVRARPLLRGRSRMRQRTAIEVLGPMLLVVIVGLLSTQVSAANEQYFLSAIISVAMVVAIYVFVGNSGVLSFGQISFVAVGGFASGVMTIPVESKSGVLPELFPILRDHTVGMVPSLVLAALVGGVLALVLGLPLMRLSGLAAGIATFAVLEITHNILREWTKIGPGATTLSLIPESDGALQPVIGVLVIIGIAYAYQRSRLGRMLRASREDAPAARPSASTSTASGSGHSRSRARSRASRAGSTSTSSARSRPTRSIWS